MSTVRLPDSSELQSGAGSQGPNVPGKIADSLRRRYIPLLLAGLLSAAASVGAGLTFGKQSWHAEGKIRFTGVPEDEKRFFPEEKIENYKEMIITDENIDPLMQKFNLTILNKTMKEVLLKVEIPPNTNLMSISVDWANQKEGADIVNELMRLHLERSENIRQRTIDSTLSTQLSNLDHIKKQYDRILVKHKELSQKHDVVNLTKASEDISKERETILTTATATEQKQRELKAQIERMNPEIARLRDKLARGEDLEEGTGEKSYSVRKRELQKLIDEEELKLSDSKNNYEAKEKEVRSLKPLVQMGVVAKKDLDAAVNDRDRFSDATKKLQQSLENRRRDLRELPLNSLEGEQLKLKEVMETNSRDLSGFKANLEIRQQRLKELTAQLKEFEPIDLEKKSIEAQKDAVEKTVRTLKDMKERKIGFQSVEQEAQASKEPVSSTTKKIVLAVFAIPMLLVAGFIVVRDMASNLWRSEMLAARLGLPILGHIGAGSHAVNGAVTQSEARGLALRVRQYVPESGSVLLFNSLNPGKEIDTLMNGISRYLAMRDDKVLVIDGRIANDENTLTRWIDQPVAPEPEDGSQAQQAAPGLVQYLIFEGQNVRDFIWPTRIPSVDYMAAGGPCSSTDILASQSMKDLFDKLTKAYTLILIIGPALNQTVDTEILAAYAQGIVVLFNGSVSSFSSEMEEFFRSLKEANAPLLGAVIYD